MFHTSNAGLHNTCNPAGLLCPNWSWETKRLGLPPGTRSLQPVSWGLDQLRGCQGSAGHNVTLLTNGGNQPQALRQYRMIVMTEAKSTSCVGYPHSHFLPFVCYHSSVWQSALHWNVLPSLWPRAAQPRNQQYMSFTTSIWEVWNTIQLAIKISEIQ